MSEGTGARLHRLLVAERELGERMGERSSPRAPRATISGSALALLGLGGEDEIGKRRGLGAILKMQY